MIFDDIIIRFNSELADLNGWSSAFEDPNQSYEKPIEISIIDLKDRR